MTTGERIKTARKAAGMTQKELGEKLGLSFQSIAQWENDMRKPKYGTLKKLADALDVYVYDLSSPEDTEERVKRLTDFFMADDGIDEPVLSQDDKDRRAKYQSISQAMEKLNDKGQTVAVERVEELTKVPDYQKDPEDK